MPDGTTRRKAADGTPLAHFMGCSTFAEYTVVSEISCAKISDDADLETVCMLGCGVATGWGAAWKTANVEEGASVAVFGCGAVGLAVIQAAKIRGARRIFAIDVNDDKKAVAEEFGATDFLNPTDEDTPIQQRLVAETQWGVDYTFDCTGNVEVMRAALEAAHRGWGVSPWSSASPPPARRSRGRSRCKSQGGRGNGLRRLQVARRGIAAVRPATQRHTPPKWQGRGVGCTLGAVDARFPAATAARGRVAGVLARRPPTPRRAGDRCGGFRLASVFSTLGTLAAALAFGQYTAIPASL